MKSKTLIIGVAGGSGSGKTTIVNAIVKKLNYSEVVVIQHDSYYKDRSDIPLSERKKINYDHPDAIETDLLVRHLNDLINGKPIKKPKYDFITHTRKKEVEIIKPVKCIIVEGVIVLAEKALRDLMDIKIFVDTDPDIRFIRRFKRDLTERGRSIDSVIKQYLETVRPMHLLFVEPSKRYADIIIPEGNNPVALEMVISMIEKAIKERM
jgi:uridine kinase